MHSSFVKGLHIRKNQINPEEILTIHWKKMKFSIKDFLSKLWPNAQENLLFCAVIVGN